MTTPPKFTGRLIVIEGPTASGKTALAIELALLFNTEIISADSRQFYKEIPIGTAAPDTKELNKVAHHFVGNLSVTDDYNVSKFEHDVLKLLNYKLYSQPVVIMVGGSGLYINAVCNGIDKLPDIDETIRRETVEIFDMHGIVALQEKLEELDPSYHKEVDLNNPKRLIRAIEVCLQTGVPYSQLRKNQPQKREFKIIKIGIKVPREILISKINNRVEAMMQQGWIDEAKEVYKFKNLNSLNTLGYKELFAFFENKTTLKQATEKIKTNTRRYAKRQMTWFRKDKKINWFENNNVNEIEKFIRDNL